MELSPQQQVSSPQQQAVVDFAITGFGSLNLIARAGCGKTTTLLAVTKALVAAATNKISIFIGAYNKAIAAEISGKLAKAGIEDWKQDQTGRWIAPLATASTMHSAGFKAWKKVSPKVTVDEKKLGNILDALVKSDPSKEAKIEEYRAFTLKVVSLAKQRAFGVLTTINDLSKWYELVEHFGLDEELPENFDVEIAIKFSIWLFRRSLDACKEVVDYDDMILAPLYFNARVFTYDFVFIDEAQDTNPARRALAKKMMKPGTGRLIAVGDPCQPAGTMVSVITKKANRWAKEVIEQTPIECVKEGDLVISYDSSSCAFIKGRKVEGVSANPYEGTLIEARLANGLMSRYTPNHHCLANFSPLRNRYAVYLMGRGSQYRIGFCKMDYGEVGDGPGARLRAEGADSTWILSTFTTREEAYIAENVLGADYGIPQIMFTAKNNSKVSQATLDSIWSLIGDNEMKAVLALEAHGRSINHPLMKSSEPISLKRPCIVHASNLIDGCLMLPYSDERNNVRSSDWQRATFTRVQYKGNIYSLTVEGEQLYCADGILTHNCQAIYGFTGADADSMPILAKELGSKELPLTVTYRCPKAVVRMAQQWVPDMVAHESAPEGIVLSLPLTVEQGSKNPSLMTTEVLTKDDAILCRNTKPLVELAFSLIRRGTACQVEGRDIAAGLVAVINKWKVVKLDALAKAVAGWRDREVSKLLAKGHEAKADRINDQAETIIVLTQKFLNEGKNSVSELISFIRSIFGDTPDGEKPRVLTLATVHKSKGREWKRVYLLGRRKYMPSKFARKDWQTDQERNLMYVAVTRAMSELIDVEVNN